MPLVRRQIPPERKAAFYIGKALQAIGWLTFLSVFVSFIGLFLNIGHRDMFMAGSNFMASMMIRGFGGMVLMMIGATIENVAVRGLAGSGVILDPDQARQDLEPWNRMKGGMVQDAASEVELVNKLAAHLDREDEASPAPEVKEVVKVRCRACQALNDETARFCNQCGSQL